MEKVLEIKNLYLDATLKTTETELLKDINLNLYKGKILGILGESGGGKTMLSLSVMALTPQNCRTRGEIIYRGENLLKKQDKEMEKLRGRNLVLMPQGADFLNQFLSVKTQLYESIKISGISNKHDIEKKAEELLYTVGFSQPSKILPLYPFKLSGGMAQRVILAIGMCGNPDIVMADEPTRGMEESSGVEIISAFKSIFPNSGIMIITHDINIAKMCDEVLVINGGMVMEYGDSQTVINTPLHPYTKSLKNAIPIKTCPKTGKYICKNMPKEGACPFYIGCPLAVNKCQSSTPPLVLNNDIKVRCYNV